MLASRRQMAFVYIVRSARGSGELGPFANDGAFVKDVLEEMASQTGDSFSPDTAEAFTFSSGISEFNTFIRAASGELDVRAVYNIDPAGGMAAIGGGIRKQYLSGQTTNGPLPGFEWMPMDRWQNEFRFPEKETFDAPWPFNYMHNHCMPLYVLNLALQT
jgi:hypothetical protein